MQSSSRKGRNGFQNCNFVSNKGCISAHSLHCSHLSFLWMPENWVCCGFLDSAADPICFSQQHQQRARRNACKADCGLSRQPFAEHCAGKANRDQKAELVDGNDDAGGAVLQRFVIWGSPVFPASADVFLSIPVPAALASARREGRAALGGCFFFLNIPPVTLRSATRRTLFCRTALSRVCASPWAGGF